MRLGLMMLSSERGSRRFDGVEYEEDGTLIV